MDTSFETTRLLYEQAQREAIGKVFDEQLYQHPIALDLNHTGLEDLMPPNASLPIAVDKESQGLDAILAFGDIDPQVLDHASGYLERDGVFCYLTDVNPIDPVQFYQWPGPFWRDTPQKFNDFLQERGFSVIRQGTRQATRSVYAGEVPATLPPANVPMYGLADGVMLLATVHYTISRVG